MRDDRISIEDPPDYQTRFTHDDLTEALGDSFEITADEQARLARAAQRGPQTVRMALAGDPVALAEMRALHVIRWEVRR